MSQPRLVDPRDQIVGRGERPEPRIDPGPDLRLVVQHLMQHRMHRRQLVLQPVLELVDQQLAVVFFLDQASGNPALLAEERAIVLDAPDGERADRPIERQQGEARVIGKGIAEIDDDAERAADQRGDDADAEAAEHGRKEHGRKIRREKHVGPHMGEAPARQRRNQQAGDRKRKAQAERRRCHAVPALAGIRRSASPCAVRSRYRVRNRANRQECIAPSHKQNLPCREAGRNSACCGADFRGAVVDRCPPFGVKGFENRDIPWAGWMARSR